MTEHYLFEVSLNELEHRAWRRFVLKTNATFADLHRAIQDSFGWKDYHAWEFRTGERSLAGLPDDFGEFEVEDGEEVPLASYFTGRGTTEWCEYTYDFGDDWLHEVKVLRVLTDYVSGDRKLLGGARACPPEDCGGLPGYENLLKFLKTGKDEMGGDPKGLKTWLGSWKPDVFDIAATAKVFDKGCPRPRSRPSRR
jgi:hypothetical protein